MARTLIIGYGNTLRSDDALGWRAAEQIAASQAGGSVEVQLHHQLGPELAQPLSEVDLAIFIDAGCQGTPGQVSCQQVEPSDASSSFTHHFNPGLLLAMAKHLFGRYPRTFIISVIGESFACGETLSPAVQRALPAVQRLVADLLAAKQAALLNAGNTFPKRKPRALNR
jgi:hydrogenase maturation protease